jgi:hypothetical protein
LKEMIDKISTAKFYPTDHLSKGLWELENKMKQQKKKQEKNII